MLGKAVKVRQLRRGRWRRPKEFVDRVAGAEDDALVSDQRLRMRELEHPLGRASLHTLSGAPIGESGRASGVSIAPAAQRKARPFRTAVWTAALVRPVSTL